MMPLGLTVNPYRPELVTLTGYRVEVDGWGAGMPGTDSESANGVVDAAGTTWYLTKLEGWADAPPPRNSLSQRVGQHGDYDGPAVLDVRALTIEGYAICTDRVSTWRARDIVASVCGDPSLGLLPLVVSQADYQDRLVMVRRSGDTKTEMLAPGVFRWSMILVAPDPRRYSAELFSQAVSLPAVGAGGLGFPLSFPLTFGAGLSGGQMPLTNNGTLTTWPTWLIDGPVQGPIITNEGVGGPRLLFDPTFVIAAGQTVTVDTDTRTAALGGVSVRHRLTIADWFGLEPGTTSVRFTSATGYDPAALLTAQWRDAWV